MTTPGGEESFPCCTDLSGRPLACTCKEQQRVSDTPAADTATILSCVEHGAYADFYKECPICKSESDKLRAAIERTNRVYGEAYKKLAAESPTIKEDLKVQLSGNSGELESVKPCPFHGDPEVMVRDTNPRFSGYAECKKCGFARPVESTWKNRRFSSS